MGILVLALVPALVMILFFIPLLVRRLGVLTAVDKIKLEAVEWVCSRQKTVRQLHYQVAAEMRKHFQRINFSSTKQDTDIATALEAIGINDMTLTEFSHLLQSMNVYLCQQDLDSIIRRVDRDLGTVLPAHQFGQ